MNHLVSPDKSELVPQLKIFLCSCNNNLEIFAVDVVVDGILSGICDNHLGLRLFVEVIKPKALGSCFQETWQGQKGHKKTKHKLDNKNKYKIRKKIKWLRKDTSRLSTRPPSSPRACWSSKSIRQIWEKIDLRKREIWKNRSEKK